MAERNVKSFEDGVDREGTPETSCRLGWGTGESRNTKSVDSNNVELTSIGAFHEIFWPAYPRKIGKFAALQAWKRLRLRDDDQNSLDAIMRGLQAYIDSEWNLAEPRFIPHASTWLNQHRWEDFPLE